MEHSHHANCGWKSMALLIVGRMFVGGPDPKKIRSSGMCEVLKRSLSC